MAPAGICRVGMSSVQLRTFAGTVHVATVRPVVVNGPSVSTTISQVARKLVPGGVAFERVRLKLVSVIANASPRSTSCDK